MTTNSSTKQNTHPTRVRAHLGKALAKAIDADRADALARARLRYARPADPEEAGDEDDDDFASAAATAKAHIGKALAVLAKFYGDMMGAGDILPGDREIIDTYAEGSIALYGAVQYVGTLLDYWEAAHPGDDLPSELLLAWKELNDERDPIPRRIVHAAAALGEEHTVIGWREILVRINFALSRLPSDADLAIARAKHAPRKLASKRGAR